MSSFGARILAPTPVDDFVPYYHPTDQETDMEPQLPELDALVHPDLKHYVAKNFPFAAGTTDADLT